MKWCNNKECEGYEELEDNHCSQAATIDRCLEAMPLTSKTEPVDEVPCSDWVMEPALDRLNKRVKELEDDNEEAIRHGNRAMENLLGRTISSYKMAIDYLASRAL